MAERLAPAVRRERILDTALAIIDAEGHRHLTMAALARRCDMSAPGLMHHFPDMPTLLVALVRLRDERDREAFALALEPTADARAYLDAVVANIVARPRAAQLFVMVSSDALDPAHPGHGYFQERADQLASWLADLLGDEDPARARRVFAAMDGLQAHYLRDPERFDLQRHWRATADALLGPLARS